MRIISGLYKGKKILLPTDKNTRPLKDLTKESIFNLIIHSKFSKIELERSNVLDLFAGSGSFGLECLSRKSNFVTFVENYRSVIKILKNNKYFSSGGRVLNSTVLNKNLKVARSQALEILDNLDWENKYYRRDIGYQVIDK